MEKERTLHLGQADLLGEVPSIMIREAWDDVGEKDFACGGSN